MSDSICGQKMNYRLISHRGNINGVIEDSENHPDYIMAAVNSGYDVELDLRLVGGKWYLGHDTHQYEIEEDFLFNLASKDHLWTHIKNIDALFAVTSNKKYIQWNYFWHQTDDYVFTSKSYIWAYPGKKLVKNSICVLPETANYDIIDIQQCLGVCSDYVELYK